MINFAASFTTKNAIVSVIKRAFTPVTRQFLKVRKLGVFARFGVGIHDRFIRLNQSINKI